MQLKQIIDELLKERNRSLSWLAQQTGKTFDGLRLSLLKESVKYNDLKKIAEILEVSACVFFKDNSENEVPKNLIEEDVIAYGSMKKELDACKELAYTLKNQIKDKEKIIELLNKS